mgnify:CR=1 FL=1
MVSKIGGRTHIEHKHVEGYKDLPPEEKATHVRGMLCQACNNGLGAYEKLKEKAEIYLQNRH